MVELAFRYKLDCGHSPRQIELGCVSSLPSGALKKKWIEETQVRYNSRIGPLAQLVRAGDS